LDKELLVDRTETVFYPPIIIINKYACPDAMNIAMWFSFAANPTKGPNDGKFAWPQYKQNTDTMLLFASGNTLKQLVGVERIDGNLYSLKIVCRQSSESLLPIKFQTFPYILRIRLQDRCKQPSQELNTSRQHIIQGRIIPHDTEI